MGEVREGWAAGDRNTGKPRRGLGILLPMQHSPQPAPTYLSIPFSCHYSTKSQLQSPLLIPLCCPWAPAGNSTGHL